MVKTQIECISCFKTKMGLWGRAWVPRDISNKKHLMQDMTRSDSVWLDGAAAHQLCWNALPMLLRPWPPWPKLCRLLWPSSLLSLAWLGHQLLRCLPTKPCPQLIQPGRLWPIGLGRQCGTARRRQWECSTKRLFPSCNQGPWPHMCLAVPNMAHRDLSEFTPSCNSKDRGFPPPLPFIISSVALRHVICLVCV